MKKRLLSIVLSVSFILTLTSCASSGDLNSTSAKSKIKEYDVEEFGKLLNETNEMFESESEYLTKEELYAKEGYELYKKCSKKTGLPFDTEVVIRGKKQNSISGFTIVSSDGKYSIPCFFDKGEKNISLFIPLDENVVVSGTFSSEEDSYGCLTNPIFKSPSKIDTDYVNNIDTALKDMETISDATVVFGEVKAVQPLNKFENAMSLMKNTVTYESMDYYYDTVITLSSEERSIYFMYDDSTYGEIKVGDKIGTQGYIYDLMHIKKADGTTDVYWGLMGNIYDVYIIK